MIDSYVVPGLCGKSGRSFLREAGAGHMNVMDANYVRSAAIAASVMFDKKWKTHVLCAMRGKPVRLGQLVRLIPGTSKKVLTQHLRELEADGIIVRTDKSDLVLHVEYALVEPLRVDILVILDQFAGWGARYLSGMHQRDRSGTSIYVDEG